MLSNLKGDTALVGGTLNAETLRRVVGEIEAAEIATASYVAEVNGEAGCAASIEISV